jgi:hypothetical protein
VWGIFREMPFLVKLGTLWLLVVLFAAIYAQLDVKVFNGSLPLGDPNLQLNGFNPATASSATVSRSSHPRGRTRSAPMRSRVTRSHVPSTARTSA